MKEIICIIMILSLFVATAFAAEFIPTQLKISAVETIQYDFDGSKLEIPVQVSGTAAGVIFTVFTKDMAEKILAVQNGYLGWHYVNKVDTCIFKSPVYSFDQGKQIITWDGKDADGGMVPAGEYTYYIWGYDYVNQKTLVSSTFGAPSREGYLEEFDENGLSLIKPYLLKASNPAQKWTIGSDPQDDILVEKTTFTLPADYIINGTLSLDPSDHNYFYVEIAKKNTDYQAVWKFQWVPGGEAVLDTKWGENGAVVLPVIQPYWGTGVYSDLNNLYVAIEAWDAKEAWFYIVSFDGELTKTIDLSDWWVRLQDEAAGGDPTDGPNDMWERHGYLYFNAHVSCLKSLVNPSAALENEEDFWVWHNGNGDYIDDHNFEPDSAKPWVCFDFNVAPYTYTITADDNLFSITPLYDMGAVSFALMAPDGTGIGNFSYSGETAGIKWGNYICDNGSAYDGIYTDNNSTGTEETKGGTWYIAHDSIKGIITSNPVSVEETPEIFSVAQNSPNPFNPTTTISFTTAEAVNVSIDVYNVAGQKIATIADEFMSAGSHSVIWDASGLSAGVYFYTVKAGEFSKTMKMTLLK